MEFAAMVRSVLKLSAGIQLALRSSLGRVRLPLPAGTGTHCHAHSWQTSPKTWGKKPGDSWMLLSQDALKRGKTRKKKRHLFMYSESRTFGATRKSLFSMPPKHYLYVLCMTPLIFILPQKAVKNRQKSIGCPYYGLYANFINVCGMLHIN